jgi:hypothetical protein
MISVQSPDEVSRKGVDRRDPERGNLRPDAVKDQHGPLCQGIILRGSKFDALLPQERPQ